MPVEPIPCPPGGGGTPVEVTACCAPSIATAPLCRPDGTTVLLVVRGGCAECGQAAPAPGVVGWIDAANGVFTAGPAPADTGPCEAGCIDTVCRQRCDDTDGDGTADTAYSELWCVRTDGSATLVLAYQDDPAIPYTPISPVECEYGCPESETATLCDDTGPFLRRYTWLNGTASYLDFALDGTTPHVITGAVRACTGTAGGETECPEQTTPTATLGLCLADGTPIAVVVTRDCAGTISQDGWLNLTTGAYTSGPPPAGAAACGDSRAYELAGLLCDTDPATGDVLGLVLVEYQYNGDGSLAGVRLVDPGTGATYTLQGELRHCPAGTADQLDQDLTVLCDTAADGTITAFVRDYRRDPASGEITGHTDYTLVGAPYTPTGTVGVCPLATTGEEPCRNTSTLLVCDLPGDGEPTPTVTDTAPAPYNLGAAGTDPVTGGAATLWSGGVLTIPPDPTGATDGSVQRLRAFAATVQAPRPGCDTGTATVTASIRVEREGPDPGCAGTGVFTLVAGGTALSSAGVTPANAPVGTVRVLTVSAQVPAADLAAGTVALAGRLETYHLAPGSCPGGTGPGGARIGGWTVDDFTVSVAYAQEGCAEQVLATVVTDCETGQVESVTYTLLDGTPYTPTGTIGQCSPAGPPAEPEPCRDTSTVLLCDLPTGGTPTPTVTDTDPNTYVGGPPTVPVPGGAHALWAGGSITIGPDAAPGPHPSGIVRTVAATVQAPRPACDTGTAHVRFSVDVAQLGPTAGCGPTGWLMLYNGATRVTYHAPPNNAPVGWTGTLVVSADVPAADLASGQIAVVLGFDTYDSCDGVTASRPSWELSNFTAATAYDQTGCATQILRTVLTDCETGAVLDVTDTTLDGRPHTVAGEVGQCAAAGGGECCDASDPEACRTTTTVRLCDIGVSESVTVLDPTTVLGADGWQVSAFTGSQPGYGPAGTMPYPAYHRINGLGVGQLSVRPDFQVGPPTVPWPGYDAAPIRWTLAKQFTLTTGGLATVTVTGFKGDHGARIRINGQDLGLYAQYNQPVDGDQFRVPVVAGTNTIEIEDRDINHVSYIQGRVDVAVAAATPFLRHFTLDCFGAVVAVTDTTVDGAPYTVAGEVADCTTPGEDEPGGTPGGATPCMVQSVLERCACDDTDGDGIADTEYTELFGVDCTGAITPLGTYTPDLSQPYTPIAPADCEGGGPGAPPATGVQARRTELSPGQTWDAASTPTLQSVTAVAHGGNGTVTTADGTTTLHTSEAATWSVARDTDALLTGPLTITAGTTGTVTVTYTLGVTL